MKTRTYKLLKRLHEKHGPREFGKLCQKFLAIAFRMAGYGHVVERGVQGVDVDAAEESGRRHAVEVKTTEKNEVRFERKDEVGLQKRKEDGYEPVLAVLRLAPFGEWVLARADSLRPGSIHIDSLRPYRLTSLEESLRARFVGGVEDHFQGAEREAQKYLDAVLREKGIDLRRQ